MTSEAAPRRTPLYDVHRSAGARMVAFAGWDMPVQYSGVLEEALAVRRKVGIFDISHMGRLRLRGPQARDDLQRSTSNNVDKLVPGAAQYSLMTAESGGIYDDVIVYRVAGDEFLVVVNASNTARDIAVLRSGLSAGTELHDETAETAMMAVQGPDAVAALTPLTDLDIAGVGRFRFGTGHLLGKPATFCRTGYTGEDGFEIVCAAGDGPAIWQAVVGAGAMPCGLGARDTLRTEAGYPLYGHEIELDVSPVEAGLMWAVDLDKGGFAGRAAIAEAKRRGPSRKLMGLVMEDRAIPRQGYPVQCDDQPAGTVTSGAFSAIRGAALGMAYIEATLARAGAHVDVVIRGVPHQATIVRKTQLLIRECTLTTSKGG